MTKNEITFVRSLSERRARQQEGLFVAEGRKLVGDLLAAGMRAHSLYYTDDGEGMPALAQRITAREMERISSLKTPAPLLALFEIPVRELSLPRLKGELVLALDGVQDPGNLGTIVRTADWLGIPVLLCSPDCADCFAPKVVQATMGALARVQVHYGALTEWLPAFDQVYGTFLEGTPLYDAPLSPSGAIVMGSEGRGISAQVAALVSDKLYIPPVGTPAGESLNVATATAIVAAEFRRRFRA